MSSQQQGETSAIARLRSRFSSLRRWQKALSVAGLAIGGTIIGDNAFQLLTGDFADLSNAERLWRAALVLVSLLLIAGGIEEILDWFARRGEPEVAVTKLVQIEPQRALVVMASASRDSHVGPHWTAFNAMAKAPGSPLEYVYVIHSTHERSIASAQALIDEIREHYAGRITGISEQLDTDFEDPVAIFSTIKTAIAMAVNRVGDPSKVVLDATGGTAMASVGAALAKLEHPEVVLSYIPMKPDGGFGDTVRKVNLELIPAPRRPWGAPMRNR